MPGRRRALVQPWRHSHNPLEVPTQVTLVREANLRRDSRWRSACAQARLCPAHALLNQPRVWRQAVGASKATRQGERIEPDHRRKLAEAQVL
jgi:hypothetical protein